MRENNINNNSSNPIRINIRENNINNNSSNPTRINKRENNINNNSNLTRPEESIAKKEGEDDGEWGDDISGEEDHSFTQNWKENNKDGILLFCYFLLSRNEENQQEVEKDDISRILTENDTCRSLQKQILDLHRHPDDIEDRWGRTKKEASSVLL